MQSLEAVARAVEVRSVPLPTGETVPIRTLRIRFSPAVPPRLTGTALPKTYRTKPLVRMDGQALFGELAILRLLERDGWDGVWVDTFHGRKFWRGMPHDSVPVILPAATQVRYDTLVAVHGKAGGFFDVMAWREGRFLFVEYKGAGDRSNRNERHWIAAALASGVSLDDLAFVLY